MKVRGFAFFVWQAAPAAARLTLQLKMWETIKASSAG